jgi:shikimate dehydrogenase
MSVNTIVNTDGHLKGYNTDYKAVFDLLKSHQVPTDTPFAVRGSGGMAKAVVCALKDAGFTDGLIVARNESAGKVLARQYGYSWKPELAAESRGLLVNVTPIGMAGGKEAEALSFPEDRVRSARFVFDVVALPAETPLIRLARSLGKSVISGAEVAALQAVEQFVLYTGSRPNAEQIDRAAAFARS